MQRVAEGVKHGADAAAVATVGYVWMGDLQTITAIVAAVLTIVWTIFRLVEMFTGQKIHQLLGRKK